jgi:hypothetical protein
MTVNIPPKIGMTVNHLEFGIWNLEFGICEFVNLEFPPALNVQKGKIIPYLKP